MELFSDSDSETSSTSASSSASGKVDIRETRSRSSSSSSSSGSSSSSSASSSASDQLNINQEYAARFHHNKERADLHRLQEKHGAGDLDEDESESSSEDETEDEDGEQVTADVDAAILTTLAKIRAKDESIYETGKRVFDEERSLASSSKLLPSRTLTRPGSGKKVTLGDYQRKRIQELMETEQDPAKALAEATMIRKRGEEEDTAGPDYQLSHTREQEELRREVTNAFHGADEGEEEEEDEGGFFTRKDRQEDEEDEADAEAYRKYLLGVLGGKEREQAVREALRTQAEEAAQGDGGAAPSADDGESKKAKRGQEEQKNQTEDDEDFLMNYVLNRGWVDNPNAAPKLKRRPVKEEARRADERRANTGEERDWDAEAADLDSEDSFDSRAEAFENAYNFRYEALEGGEADAQIQSYARNPVGSVRRKEEKRKLERAERKRRKEEEKEEKKKELDRLRSLKRKGIVNRLKALKEATGSQAVDFGKLDLDKDFDPDEHDKVMQGVFGEDYYGDDDDEKPTWDDEIDISHILAEEDERQGASIGNDKGKSKNKAKEVKKEKKKAEKGKGGGEDDERIEMDADFVNGEAEDDEAPEEPKRLSKAEKKKLKKKEKAMAKRAAAASGGGAQDADGVDEDEMDAEIPVGNEQVVSMTKEERKKKLSKAVDDYYNLEYEDVIGGDQPTRFKYTEVPKSNFGLSAIEILLADDDQLNKVVGLKHLQPYKRGKTRPKDLSNRLRDFRRGLADRKGVAEGEEEERRSKGKKRKGKQERLKEKARQEQVGDAEGMEIGEKEEGGRREKKRKLSEEDGPEEGKGKEKESKKSKKIKGKREHGVEA